MYKNMLTNEDTETALQSSGGATLSLKEKKKKNKGRVFFWISKVGQNWQEQEEE